MEEDDLLGHRSWRRGSLIHKLAFKKGVHVVEKEKDLIGKDFFKEICNMAPETGFF
ncbi:MAG: hypothetical protein RBS85_00640 [Methanofastidiosum sp.]|jgi:hypothetical protein|nr:hypothetical protein [Methanofastidiosum sp.]